MLSRAKPPESENPKRSDDAAGITADRYSVGAASPAKSILENRLAHLPGCKQVIPEAQLSGGAAAETFFSQRLLDLKPPASSSAIFDIYPRPPAHCL